MKNWAFLCLVGVGFVGVYLSLRAHQAPERRAPAIKRDENLWKQLLRVDPPSTQPTAQATPERAATRPIETSDLERLRALEPKR